MAPSHQKQTSLAESKPILDAEYGQAGNISEYRNKRGRTCSFVLALFVTLALAAALIYGIVYVAQEYKAPDDDDAVVEPSNNVVALAFKHAAVAADAPQCSTIGKDIMLKGGNAVDAAIAGLLCSGLTSVQSMGIGGGFFMTIYNRTTGVSTIIDARDTAPEKATATMFEGNFSASAAGPLSIAVPGEIKGYWLAHQKYGQLPWADLFQPAIKMAEEGFPVPLGLHKAIIDDTVLLSTEPSLKVIFINPQTGELFKQGEIIKRPQLAETFKAIANEGVDAFYNGSLTDNIMKDLQDFGAIITRNDLLNYEAYEKAPVEITLAGGTRVVSPPIPASGPVLSFILNILDGYGFQSSDIATDQSSVLTYHRIVEAYKFAYGRRTDLGDDKFVNVTEIVRNLTSREYADDVRQLITDNSTHGYDYYGPTYYGRTTTTGTSHLSVLGPDGSAVSVTSTINGRFGCRSRGLRTGIIFNNGMDDFSSPNITNEFGLRPSPANFIEPGKRALSSMCPALFLEPDGSVSQVVGGAGGSKITTAVAWVAAHTLWLGQGIKEAIDIPRLHHQLLPNWIDYETGFKMPIIQSLKKLGHNVSEYAPGKSIVQGIQVRDGIIYPVSDYRKGGVPDGY
jgi:gamma-glutamyltranspeptidase/glutathione hydrolase/leukotriene-C4 hydrolase